ncbi:MAG: tetratricopeptide repeat protein [Saprospiraceae bacterium]
MSKMPLVASIYNPQNQSKAELIEGFVVRKKIFKKLFTEIETATMEHPEQHYLIVGKRGMGKTTLLLRLAYEVENSEPLSAWLMPLVFNEEEYSIRKLYKFWIRIGELMRDNDNGLFLGLPEEMEQLSEQYHDDDAYEKAIFELLSKRLQQQQKKIILFIDNVGDMFTKFTEKEAHRLRKILQTSADIRIFAASSKLIEAFYTYSHPFYEFFKMEELSGLDQQETEDILLQLGKAYQQEDKIKHILEHEKGRVEALRRLTGGVIRTMVLLFEIFIDKKDGDAFNDLETILDRVTPLYKHRMDDLSPNQQEIVEAIAFAWDAINVKEIKQKTRMESKVISAQLNALVKNDLITRIPTTTKNHFYQISERFFNIWYLMRHGKNGDKRKVRWLVRFLEEWCDNHEIVARAKQHISQLKKVKQYKDRSAYYLTEAIAQSKHLPKAIQHELLTSTRSFLSERRSEWLAYLSESDVSLSEKGFVLIEEKKYEEALSHFLQMKEKDAAALAYCYYYLGKTHLAENYWKMAIEKGHVGALNNLALLYKNEYKDFEKARDYYLQAIEKGDVAALNNLALLYEEEYKDPEKARDYYLQAIEKGHVAALNNLALLYKNEYKDPEKARDYYLQAIEKGDVNAMYNLAVLYDEEYKDPEKARDYYLQAIEKGHVNAMYNLANLYANTHKDPEKARDYYLQAIEKGHVDALNNLAVLYDEEYKDPEKARDYYLQAIEKGDVNAMYNLALLYANTHKDPEKARDYYLQAIEKGHVDALNNLALLYDEEYKDPEKARDYYLQAIEKGDVNAMYNLAVLYEEEYKDPEKARDYYLQAIEKGDVDAMNNLAYLFFTEANKDKKAEAIAYAEEAIKKCPDNNIQHTLASIYLWNDKFNLSLQLAEQFLYDSEFLSEESEAIFQYLLLLLAKKQYNFLLAYFNDKKHELLQLKDRFKPIYYALMYELQGQYPNEYLRMGEELRETVEEILKEVEAMKEKYA